MSTHRKNRLPRLPTTGDRDPPATDKRVVFARLSAAEIKSLSDLELRRLIMDSHLSSLRPDVARHLEFADRETLEQMAHLACICCRNEQAGEQHITSRELEP